MSSPPWVLLYFSALAALGAAMAFLVKFDRAEKRVGRDEALREAAYIGKTALLALLVVAVATVVVLGTCGSPPAPPRDGGGDRPRGAHGLDPRPESEDG